MTLAVESVAPSEVFAGDTHIWTVTPPAGFAPADGYAASIRYVGASTSLIGTAAASAENWECTLSAANSAALGSGAVRWQLIVTQGSDVRTIAAGTFRLIAAPKIGQGDTAVSQAERTLQLWLDRAEQQASDLLQEYDIGGTRRAKRYTPEQIQAQIRFWQARVVAERNGGRLPSVKLAFPGLSGLRGSIR